jgi:hypothetical protein
MVPFGHVYRNGLRNYVRNRDIYQEVPGSNIGLEQLILSRSIRIILKIMNCKKCVFSGDFMIGTSSKDDCKKHELERI